MTWKIVVHATAEKELDEQPSEIRGKLDQLVSLIETFGLERIPAKYARHLQDDLWEFRLIGKDGIARALYVTALDQRIVIVRKVGTSSESLDMGLGHAWRSQWDSDARRGAPSPLGEKVARRAG